MNPSFRSSFAGAFRRAWAVWVPFARRLGELQGRILLAILYALLVIPPGIVLRMLADPLRRRRPRPTNWVARRAAPATLEEARRQ